MKTEWNYSDLAKHYVNRPEYAPAALSEMYAQTVGKSDASTKKVCDVGAGVAHLTIPLLEEGFQVDAVEPNDEMRAIGKERTSNFSNVSWFEGTGEETGRPSSVYSFVTFGSSFNVTDRPSALIETDRLLGKNGWFACMWNHRNLDNPLQAYVEEIIKKHVEGYGYGTRREDQTEVILASGLFGGVKKISGEVKHTVSKSDWLDAWKSHATLERQAGGKFREIIADIGSYLSGMDSDNITIPYTTNIWIAQKIS